MTVDDLVASGKLERVVPDPDGARLAAQEAGRHIASAAKIAGDDPNGAYQLAYDAARKAVMARMRTDGIRVRRGEGAHTITAEYARTAVDDHLGRRLDGMRRRRNRSEYGSAYFSTEEVVDAIDVARALLAAV